MVPTSASQPVCTSSIWPVMTTSLNARSSAADHSGPRPATATLLVARRMNLARPVAARDENERILPPHPGARYGGIVDDAGGKCLKRRALQLSCRREHRHSTIRPGGKDAGRLAGKRKEWADAAYFRR